MSSITSTSSATLIPPQTPPSNSSFLPDNVFILKCDEGWWNKGRPSLLELGTYSTSNHAQCYPFSPLLSHTKESVTVYPSYVFGIYREGENVFLRRLPSQHQGFDDDGQEPLPEHIQLPTKQENLWEITGTQMLSQEKLELFSFMTLESIGGGWTWKYAWGNERPEILNAWPEEGSSTKDVLSCPGAYVTELYYNDKKQGYEYSRYSFGKEEREENHVPFPGDPHKMSLQELQAAIEHKGDWRESGNGSEEKKE